MTSTIERRTGNGRRVTDPDIIAVVEQALKIHQSAEEALATMRRYRCALAAVRQTDDIDMAHAIVTKALEES